MTKEQVETIIDQLQEYKEQLKKERGIFKWSKINRIENAVKQLDWLYYFTK